jgi:uncharacterized membrane protein YeaQ/YmgE (transglycosylase-associated protein family)
MDFDLTAFGDSVQALVESLGLHISNQQLLFCAGVGIVAGWLASQIVGGKGGIIRYLVAGILGSFLGPVILSYTGFEIPDFGIAYVTDAATATVGAVVIVLVARIVG